MRGASLQATGQPTNLTAADDRRHRPAPGAKGRDSLYFSVILPEERLSVYLYTYVDHAGVAGRQAAVWGAQKKPLYIDFVDGVGVGDMDFDDWEVAGMRLGHPEPLHTADIRFAGDGLEVEYTFEGTHEAFDFARNVGGCPQWMAANRFEQAGRCRGRMRLGDREYEIDQPGHRDHSWGRRNWRLPQHWKWITAMTESGNSVNVFRWIARGEVGTNGYVLRDGKPVGLVDARLESVYHDDMTHRSLRAVLLDEDGGETELDYEAFGSANLAPEGSPTTVNEAACRGTLDGEPARGIVETQWSTAYYQAMLKHQS